MTLRTEGKLQWDERASGRMGEKEKRKEPQLQLTIL